MKKTVFALLVIVVLASALAACVTGSSNNSGAAGYSSWEGQYYEYRFEEYWSKKSLEDRNIPRQQTQSVLKGFDMLPKPDSIMDEQPSEQDIDRAIAAYEKSLKLEPSGTWSFSGGLVYLKPPEGGVKAALARAQEKKQEWVRVVNPRNEALAAQQAVNASTNPNSPDDFDIMQNEDGGITITQYKGSRTNVIIPSTISGIKVTRIGERAFVNRRGNYGRGIEILSVVIPNTVTSIISSAFSGCKELVSVTLSDSLIYLDGFSGCTSLKSIVIPNSVRSIGSNAFANSGLTSVTLPNGLEDIGADAFRDCQLTSVQIPASVKSISQGAFNNNKITNLVISESVESLGKYSFANNPLVSLVFPASLASRREIRKPISLYGIFDGYEISYTGFIDDAFYRSSETLTRITMPANVSDGHLTEFEVSFSNFYKLQGKKAGTYVKENRVWRLQ
jgi:hypothetical protein